MQHVHWRNTARMAQLQVKEYEKEPESSLAIVLSAKRAIRPYDESLEHAIKIAATGGDFVCRSGGAVRLITGEVSDVTSDRYAFLKELALLSAGDGATLADALQHCPPSSDILAMVDDSDAEGVEALARLALGEQSVTAVVLRGFGGDEAARDVAKELRRSGISVVECRRGDLLGALASLEGTSRQPDQSGSAIASDTRRWDAAVPR